MVGVRNALDEDVNSSRSEATAGGSKSNVQIIIRGASALSFWRHAALLESKELQTSEDCMRYGCTHHNELASACARNLLQRQRMSVSAGYTPRLKHRDARNIGSRWGVQLPIRVHAARAVQNRTTTSVVTMSGAIPVGQLIYAEPGVSVISPEMCLADLAKEMALPELLMLAYELCGYFTRETCHNGEDSSLGKCGPRTSPEAIKDLAGQLDGVRGVKNLRFIARYVLAGSRSPRESCLAAILILPHAYGGYALPFPLLNHVVVLGDEASHIWGHHTCELDGCWHQVKLAYEYQSSLHDTSASRDSMKRMALERDGWRVISIGNGQITHEIQMDVIAKEIAHCLGVRLNPRGKGYRIAQRKLFNSLVRYRRF